MKTISKLLSCLLILLSVFYFSQGQTNLLINTEWNGIANIPTPVEVTFKFSADSVDLVYQGMTVEKMKFAFSDQGNLTLMKIDGNSPCSFQDKSVYKYKIDADVLTLTVVNDDCEDRKIAFDGNSYKKVLPTITQ